MKKTQVKIPCIYCMEPTNMSSTFNTTPEISAYLHEGSLDLNGAEMYLDSSKVFSNIFNKRIFFTPSKPLCYGDHIVKIKVKDFNGNSLETKWIFTIQNPKTNYNFYYGIPHAHTRYSDGRGTPTDAYEYARKNGLDFLIVTDHSNHLDGVTKHNYEYDRKTNQYIEIEDSEWYRTRIEAEVINNKYKDFLALRGFEMSSSTGHINVINTETYVEGKKQIKTLDKFFSWLRNQQNLIVSINHPDRSFRQLSYIPDVDQIVSLIEVGNGAYPRRYKNTERHYFHALDMGWHLGAINGQDNHRDNWGDGDNLTVIVAEDLSKDSFIEALRNRRTYSTETKSLRLTFKVDGYWMGSIINITPNKSLYFEISAEDNKVPIKKMLLISNKGRVLEEKKFNNVNVAEWNLSLKINNENSWFVVKVVHFNDKCGISSPIFTKTQQQINKQVIR